MNYPRGYKTCNKCGEGYLHWVSVGGFWRLSNDPKGKDLHRCKKPEREKVEKTKKDIEKAAKFDIGQRIQVVYDKCGVKGKFGRIISVDNSDNWTSDWYGIELDDHVDIGHDCLGLCSFGRGYYVHITSVITAENTLDLGE
jgi:hypothetical protein